MIELIKTYDNGHQRIFRVIGAAYEGDAAVISTLADGDVSISLADTPDLWGQLLAAGNAGL